MCWITSSLAALWLIAPVHVARAQTQADAGVPPDASVSTPAAPTVGAPPPVSGPGGAAPGTPAGAQPPAAGTSQGASPAADQGTPSAAGPGASPTAGGTPAGTGAPGTEQAASLGAPPGAQGGNGRPKLIVIDAAPYGIDPVVGQHVSAQMRATGAALGYDVLDRDATVAAAQRLHMPYPPAPADLWRATWAAQAQRGAFARVWAYQGQYVTEVVVASLDGTGPFFARGTSGAADLHATVDRLLRQALPSPSVWDAAGARQLAEQSTAPSAVPDLPSAAGFEPTIDTAGAPAEEEAPPPVGRRFSVALQTEGAIGASQDTFYNQLFGVRLDYRLSRDVMLGVYAAYANLRGKDGRVSNILTYAQVEDRVHVSADSDISVPLRLAVGYLPFNGPVVRMSAGLNIPLSERTEIGFDILTPTFWVLPDRTAVSLDISVELVYRL